jgi:hypothetical protein
MPAGYPPAFSFLAPQIRLPYPLMISPVLRIALLLCLLFPAQHAAAQGSGTNRIPTVTRLVKIFLGLEGDLAQRLDAGDADAVERMLLPDFELRTGGAPGNPVPKEEWMRRMLGQKGAWRIEQMAVHDFGEVAVVSYLQADAKSDRRKDLFITDVWKRAGDSWQLAVRYAGPSAGGTGSPAAAPERSGVPKKH